MEKPLFDQVVEVEETTTFRKFKLFLFVIPDQQCTVEFSEYFVKLHISIFKLLTWRNEALQKSKALQRVQPKFIN